MGAGLRGETEEWIGTWIVRASWLGCKGVQKAIIGNGSMGHFLGRAGLPTTEIHKSGSQTSLKKRSLEMMARSRGRGGPREGRNHLSSSEASSTTHLGPFVRPVDLGGE